MSLSPSLLTIIAGIWAVGALPTLAAGLAGWDPVGRLHRSNHDSGLSARWAWFLFELPALLTFPAIYHASDNYHVVGNVALGLWLAHYGHRSLIWCWLVPRSGTTVPLAMCMVSICFNLINGGLLGWFMGYAADYPTQWLTDPRFIVGVGLFISGAALNVWADYRLRSLRRSAREGRVIPSGGPFNFACCPNLTGEIIEWIGFATLTWSLPGLAFALWTIANLLPRALWRRNWYRRTFDDFPKHKAALIPGVL